jgi:integrase
MISLGWYRTNINNHVSRIRVVFRWAVENEMVPAAVHHGLVAVRGLRRGRTTAREPEPVRPVRDELVEAVRPHISRQAWALIRLQLLTGARAGELVGLRGVDLSTGNDIWTVEPEAHKTAHHGHAKRIYFGPQARAILEQFLDGRPVDAYLFSAAEAEEERRAELSAARKTPASWGNRPGTNRREEPARGPNDRYTVDTYRRSIERACDHAFPPPQELARGRRDREDGKKGQRWETAAEWKARLGPEKWKELQAWRSLHRWHPHQLRHNAATHIRKEFGIEVARVILGHRTASVTEIYAELDDAKAKTAMQRSG